MSRSDDGEHVTINREELDVLRDLLHHVKGKTIEVREEMPFTAKMERFLRLYEKTGNVKIAMECAGVSKTTLYRWKKRNRVLREKWGAIKARVAECPNRGQLIVDFLKELLAKEERLESGD